MGFFDEKNNKVSKFLKLSFFIFISAIKVATSPASIQPVPVIFFISSIPLYTQYTLSPSLIKSIFPVLITIAFVFFDISLTNFIFCIILKLDISNFESTPLLSIYSSFCSLFSFSISSIVSISFIWVSLS